LKKRMVIANKKQRQGRYSAASNTSRRGTGKGKHSEVSSDLRADPVEATRPGYTIGTGKRKSDFTTHAATGTSEKN
jgi:hypothetical protein